MNVVHFLTIVMNRLAFNHPVLALRHNPSALLSRAVRHRLSGETHADTRQGLACLRQFRLGITVFCTDPELCSRRIAAC